MQIQVFDVEHGFCAYVIADNGNVMLIDCGHNSATGFLPGRYLTAHSCTGVERFFVTNYDEDHLSGLPHLLTCSAQVPVRILNRNTSITGDQLRQLKGQAGPLGPGIAALLSMISTFTASVASPPTYPSTEFAVFWNEYPRFQDTNNLSLVLFLHYPGISIVFPGDLERPGWQALLQNSAFVSHLGRVNIFVASHHGRESGYLPQVFDICTPDVIVISDEAIQYQSQETSYAQHARGIKWNVSGTCRVLTTRGHGMLTITNRPGGYHILTSR